MKSFEFIKHFLPFTKLTPGAFLTIKGKAKALEFGSEQADDRMSHEGAKGYGRVSSILGSPNPTPAARVQV